MSEQATEHEAERIFSTVGGDGPPAAPAAEELPPLVDDPTPIEHTAPPEEDPMSTHDHDHDDDTTVHASNVPEEIDDLPALMTAEEVADFLRIDRTTVYFLLRTGQLPSIRTGRVYRVSRRALAYFLAGGGSPLPGREPAHVSYDLDREATPLATGRERTTAPTRRR